MGGSLTLHCGNPIINGVLVPLSLFDWPPGMEETSPPDARSRHAPGRTQRGRAIVRWVERTDASSGRQHLHDAEHDPE